jgi:hypothetical protein
MTGIRAWARRTISRKPITYHLPVSDLNWIALSVGTACRGEWPPAGKPWPTKIAPTFQLCHLMLKAQSVPTTELITIEDSRIELRRRLQSLSATNDGDLLHAQALISTMDEYNRLLNRVSRGGLITWSHLVESSDLKDSNLSCARLELTMSLGYGVERNRRENLDCHKLHALLSVLSYQQQHQFLYFRSVIRVSSREDWIRKRDFLNAHLDGLKGDRNQFHFKSTTGIYYQYLWGDFEPLMLDHLFDPCTGLSILDIPNAKASSDIGDKPVDGYLVVPWRYPPRTNIALELLSGFMIAVWQKVKPRYDPETESWHREPEVRGRVDVDRLVSSLLASELMTDKMDAKLLIVSSLAQCTVWKDLPRADGPIPTPTEHPDTSSSRESTSQTHSLREDQPTSSTSTPAQRDGNSQTGTTTLTNVEKQLPPLPDLPVPIASTAIQVEQTSTPRTTTAETSRDQPAPGASVAVQAQKDKGKRTATQSIPEHESTFTGRKPVARRRVVVEEGESSRTGARMAEASED